MGGCGVGGCGVSDSWGCVICGFCEGVIKVLLTLGEQR